MGPMFHCQWLEEASQAQSLFHTHLLEGVNVRLQAVSGVVRVELESPAHKVGVACHVVFTLRDSMKNED